MRVSQYADGTDILDALGVDVEDGRVTRAVLVLRGGHVPTLHIWRDLIEPNGREVELRMVREDYDLVRRSS